jgi:hypothetical protein|tara:strand:- start:265 stop:474 length:210 start_codon:yes stop_codon:yes gene_type:complete
MTDAVQRQVQAWIGKKWEALDKGKELFNKTVEAGVPVRVLHPNGNFKVIKNEGKLPKKEPRSSTELKTA